MSLALPFVAPADTSVAAVDLASLLSALLAGVIVPILVDLVMASTAPPWTKSGLATLLSVAAGTVSTVIWEPGTSLQVYGFNVAMAFVMSMAAHRAGVSRPVRAAVPAGLGAREPVTGDDGPHTEYSAAYSEYSVAPPKTSELQLDESDTGPIYGRHARKGSP